MTLETQTESALSDYVKKFLLEFKDEKGNFRYVDDIDNMMPSKSKFINIDYDAARTGIVTDNLFLVKILIPFLKHFQEQ